MQGCNGKLSEPDWMKMLSDKINVNTLHAKNISEKRDGFYRRYASFVYRNLRKPLFQRFLRWLLKRENIDEGVVRDIQVKIFPFKKENGNSLAGKWKEGQIFIYPRSLEFYRELATERGIETARFYVKCRALAALIHELLHAKYHSDEEEVRRLTKKYFNIYVRNVQTKKFRKNHIFELLFKQ